MHRQMLDPADTFQMLIQMTKPAKNLSFLRRLASLIIGVPCVSQTVNFLSLKQNLEVKALATEIGTAWLTVLLCLLLYDGFAPKV